MESISSSTEFGPALELSLMNKMWWSWSCTSTEPWDPDALRLDPSLSGKVSLRLSCKELIKTRRITIYKELKFSSQKSVPFAILDIQVQEIFQWNVNPWETKRQKPAKELSNSWWIVNHYSFKPQIWGWVAVQQSIINILPNLPLSQ